jgi:hypothetical protein
LKMRGWINLYKDTILSSVARHHEIAMRQHPIQDRRKRHQARRQRRAPVNPRARRQSVWNEWSAQQEHITHLVPPGIRAMRDHMQRWLMASGQRNSRGRLPPPGPPTNTITPRSHSTHTPLCPQRFKQLAIGFTSAQHTNSQGYQDTPRNPTHEETHDGLPTVKLKATTELR